MKHKIFFLILIIFSFQACEDCTITELEGPDAFDCPELMANIGDPCDDGNPNTTGDTVNGNCECVGGTDFDCPQLMLNIGDTCDDGNPDTFNDQVTVDCNCIGTTDFDCPELMANIGDPCDDGNPNTTGDTVNGNCECVGGTDFDCPQLMLNIGDPCDDGNPDTENDTVDANCICTGEPINNCEGNLLVMRAAADDNMLGNFFLDRSDKAPLDLLSFTQLESINDGSIQLAEPFPFHFSTLNPTGNTYFYGIQYEPGEGLNPLVQSSTDGSFPPSYLPTELPYAAPVYHQGDLYAINLVYDQPVVQYTILQISQTNGQPTPVFNGSVTVNSQVVNPIVFSASNGNDKVYFVSGSSLFEYHTDINAVTHVLLEPEPDPDIPVVYTGLEYRAGTDQLLAMRHQFLSAEIASTLVSVSQDGNFTQNELVVIEGFDFFQDGGVLHSTAYAQCDDKYYITTPFSLEQEIVESYLIEIDVEGQSVQSEIFPDFLFGIELQEF